MGSYLSHILTLDYPPELLSLVFLLNNSTDRTEEFLDFFRAHFGGRYGRFEIHRLDLPDSPPFNRETDGRTLQHFASLAILRNRFLELLDDEEGILSVDSDILVESHTVSRLRSWGLPLVSALVANGRNCWNVMRWNHTGQAEHIRDIPLSLFGVDLTGACYWIAREVVQSGSQYGPGTLKDGSPSMQGEDVGFCQSAQAQGYSLYCDPTLTPVHLLA